MKKIKKVTYIKKTPLNRATTEGNMKLSADKRGGQTENGTYINSDYKQLKTKEQI